MRRKGDSKPRHKSLSEVSRHQLATGLADSPVLKQCDEDLSPNKGRIRSRGRGFSLESLTEQPQNDSPVEGRSRLKAWVQFDRASLANLPIAGAPAAHGRSLPIAPFNTMRRACSTPCPKRAQATQEMRERKTRPSTMGPWVRVKSSFGR